MKSPMKTTSIVHGVVLARRLSLEISKGWLCTSRLAIHPPIRFTCIDDDHVCTATMLLHWTQPAECQEPLGLE
jgi:hypothetical protein